MEKLWTYEDLGEFLNLRGGKNGVRMFIERDPSFPRPIKVGSRTNRFIPSEIREWVQNRARSMDELKNGDATHKPKRGRPAKAVAQ